MLEQRGAIGPLLEKHQSQRVLAVDMDGVGDASGLAAGTMDVLEAQSAGFFETFLSRRHASGHHDHLNPRFMVLALASPRLFGGGEFQRLLRPAFQCGMPGIRQHIDAAFGAIEPAIDIVKQNLAGVRNIGAQLLHSPRSAR